jgi:hypothetical protein
MVVPQVFPRNEGLGTAGGDDSWGRHAEGVVDPIGLVEHVSQYVSPKQFRQKRGIRLGVAKLAAAPIMIGLPLSLIVWLTTVLLIPVFWPF